MYLNWNYFCRIILSLDLTLTRVVFEYGLTGTALLGARDLTLTRVVFEFWFYLDSGDMPIYLTLTRVVFE